jgi:hydrogenase small subunit
MSTIECVTTEEGATADRPDLLALAAEREPGAVVERETGALAAAFERAATDGGGPTVTWLQGQSCTGCTMSLLQGEYPQLSEELSAFRERIGFHTTLMTDAGDAAMAAVDPAPDVLVVEGSIPTRIPRAATLGVDEHGERKPVLDWVVELGERADVVVAVGTCAAYGGLPAAGTHDPSTVGVDANPTGARGLQFDGTTPGGVFGPEFRTGADLPVVNVPGCPAHPDHVLLTLATLLNGHRPELDEYDRPLPLFGPLVHDDCDLRPEYEAGEFADCAGDEGCLYDAGCAGVYANCDDSLRLRNGGTTVCRQAGAPCIGCVEPAFWDRFTPFSETRDSGAVAPTAAPEADDDRAGAGDANAKRVDGGPTDPDGTRSTDVADAAPTPRGGDGAGDADRGEPTGPSLPSPSPAGIALGVPLAVLLAPVAPLAAAWWLARRHLGGD